MGDAISQVAESVVVAAQNKLATATAMSYGFQWREKGSVDQGGNGDEVIEVSFCVSARLAVE